MSDQDVIVSNIFKTEDLKDAAFNALYAYAKNTGVDFLIIPCDQWDGLRDLFIEGDITLAEFLIKHEGMIIHYRTDGESNG